MQSKLIIAVILSVLLVMELQKLIISNPKGKMC